MIILGGIVFFRKNEQTLDVNKAWCPPEPLWLNKIREPTPKRVTKDYADHKGVH